MKYHIAILSGGLGSRLNNTEARPKPLVDINGLTLLSRLILSLNQTNIFEHYHIISCFESDFFKELLDNELPLINYTIHNEGKRTGRIGALNFFLESQKNIDNFFVCNGDTLFLSLNKGELINPIKNFDNKPIIYLAMPDKSRNDYKEVKINYQNNLLNYQNSGLSYISRKWLLKKISNNLEGKDLDDILFEDQDSINYTILKTEILDGGTPDRLSYMRGAIN